MGITIVTCPNCNSRYSGNDYSECPYCHGKGSGAKTKVFEKKPRINKGNEEQKRNWPWGNESSTQQKTAIIEPIVGSSQSLDNPLLNMMNTHIGETQGIESIKSNVGESANAENNASTVRVSENLGIQYASFGDLNEEKIHCDPVVTRDNIPENNETVGTSLGVRIQSIGKTTAANINISSQGDVIYPVVGWLICIKGVYYGKSFPLRSGQNHISRSPDAEIALTLDDSVTAKNAMNVIFNIKNGKFLAIGGNSSSLSFVNDDALAEGVQKELQAYDVIELGDSGNNKFIFLPLVGEKFDWNMYPQG